MCRRSAGHLVLALCALLAGSCARNAPPRDAAGIQVVPVASGIWMLTGEGGNVALAVGDQGALLVDAGYERDAPGILAAARGLTKKPLRFLLDTHWHSDHTGGNAALAAAGAAIVAQENAAARLSSEQVTRGFHVQPLPAAARPVITFRDSLTFRLGGNDALVTRVGPAHTDGDVIVVWKQANVIHTGDLTCYYAYPYFDEDTGGDITGFVAAVDGIVALSDDSTRIIGGHGQLATRADLLQYRDMVATITQRIAGQIAAGRTVAEIIASKPSAEFDARWARPGTMPADTFVALIDRSLRARPRT